MRVCDYIADFIYKEGVNHVFMVSGGGMMFLSDGLVCHPKLKTVCCHHEQAAAMAAVSYAKYTRNLGVAYVTTGCGGTNAVTGVLNAWQDNVPCLFISGQAGYKETIRHSGLALRQVGVQEADIIRIIGSITKYSDIIIHPHEIKYHLQKAVYLAKTGRPAPVWLDVPLNVQCADVNEDEMMEFVPDVAWLDFAQAPSKLALGYICQALSKATRPIIIAGQGIRIADAIEDFKLFIEKTNIPYVVSRLGIDLLPSNHPLFIGRIGTKGDRAGNFAVQNADLVLSIGSRLSISSTGFNYSTFAREAQIIVVDIDDKEHKKDTIRIDRFLHCDAKRFLNEIDIGSISGDYKEWVNKCNGWKDKWKVCLDEYRVDGEGVNTYAFVYILSNNLKYDSVVVSDAGSAFYVTSQAIMLRDKQRYITSGGQAEMGYTLPATVGVCFSRDKKEVIGITGDGSFQMNVQELQTIVHHKLPIKLFVWNNNGYSSIRETQDKFFEGRHIGTDNKSGVSFPDTEKIANAYGIQYFRINTYSDIDGVIKKILSLDEPVICEVICQKNQKVQPVVASKKTEDGFVKALPLEDMYPFLDRDEFNKEMIIKPI